MAQLPKVAGELVPYRPVVTVGLIECVARRRAGSFAQDSAARGGGDGMRGQVRQRGNTEDHYYRDEKASDQVGGHVVPGPQVGQGDGRGHKAWGWAKLCALAVVVISEFRLLGE